MKKNKLTILLVDDNEKFLNSMVQRAKLREYNVLTATNGEQALEIASKQTIHIAVLDQQMSGMEGLVVINKLKAIAPDIKTLLLTGHGDEKLKEATQALNSSYFEKKDMGSFWGFFRKILKNLETTMSAAGMAEGGDHKDALKIKGPSRKD